MKRKYVETLITLVIGLVLTVSAAFVIKVIDNRNIEKQLIKEWQEKGGECMEEPRTTVSHGQFTFECPVREETVQEKEYRKVPANYFDRERRGDINYLLQYIKDYPPTYDCALLDKYAKPNVPCWSGWGLDSIELLLNSDEKYK